MTGSLALYDAPPSSSPRLFLGLAAGTITAVAVMLGLVFSAAPRPTGASATAPTTEQASLSR